MIYLPRIAVIMVACASSVSYCFADSLAVWHQCVGALPEEVTCLTMPHPYPQNRLLCSAQEFMGRLDAYQQRLGAELVFEQGRCFVGRKTLFDGAQVHIVGDLHGSLHSLMRVLINLAHAGVLADDFSLVPGHRLLFLGDMVDRGAYGVECLNLVLMLKLASWDQVMITRGNHETLEISSRYGLADEIYAKYGSMDGMYDKILAFFDGLPLAIFLGCQGNYVQCSHGGFEPRFDPTTLLEACQDKWVFLDPLISALTSGFNWTDFVQEGVGYWRSSRGAGWCMSVNGVENLLAGKPTSMLYSPGSRVQWQTNRLKGFVRGHQDIGCGCKLLCGSVRWHGLSLDQRVLLINQGPLAYDNGPFVWKEVLNACNLSPDKIYFCSLGKDGLAPVFTFSNATMTQRVRYATYATLQVYESFDQWSLQVHELDPAWTVLPPLPAWFPVPPQEPLQQTLLSLPLEQWLGEQWSDIQRMPLIEIDDDTGLDPEDLVLYPSEGTELIPGELG